jgi:hypothetical protein
LFCFDRECEAKHNSAVLVLPSTVHVWLSTWKCSILETIKMSMIGPSVNGPCFALHVEVFNSRNYKKFHGWSFRRACSEDLHVEVFNSRNYKKFHGWSFRQPCLEDLHVEVFNSRNYKKFHGWSFGQQSMFGSPRGSVQFSKLGYKKFHGWSFLRPCFEDLHVEVFNSRNYKKFHRWSFRQPCLEVLHVDVFNSRNQKKFHGWSFLQQSMFGSPRGSVQFSKL